MQRQEGRRYPYRRNQHKYNGDLKTIKGSLSMKWGEEGVKEKGGRRASKPGKKGILTQSRVLRKG